MLEAGSLRENRRRAFRVAARLPIRHRRLSAEQWAAEERSWRMPEPSALPRDPALAAWLQRIEAKLDGLLAADGSAEPPLGAEDVHDVDLSSVGVRLAAAEGLDAGDAVLVECLVPGRVPRPVRALARVVRAEDDRVSLSFERIREADRDALVRFTQDVQRCATA